MILIINFALFALIFALYFISRNKEKKNDGINPNQITAQVRIHIVYWKTYGEEYEQDNFVTFEKDNFPLAMQPVNGMFIDFDGIFAAEINKVFISENKVLVIGQRDTDSKKEYKEYVDYFTDREWQVVNTMADKRKRENANSNVINFDK